MKRSLSILSLLAGLLVGSQADITTYAEYHLGEDGATDPPRDGSGNARHFTSAAGTAVAPDSTGVFATASTVYLRSDTGNGGFFGGPFAAMPTDNFAAGIYVSAASVDPANHGHVFTLGNGTGAFRVSLTSNGWEANIQVDPREDPGTPIGSPAALTPDTWTHLAIIRLNGSTGFYVNGVLSGVEDAVSIPVFSASGHLMVNPGGGAYYDGLTDEYRLLEFTGDETVANILAALEGIDSDMDGLFDDFEQRIIDADAADAINSLADVLPGDDFDGDMATNLREMNTANDPTDPLDVPILDADLDGLADAFEQTIIDADPADGINTIADVLPGDDFDADLYTNLEEQDFQFDPTDATSPSAVSVDFEMIAFWDFNDFVGGALTTTDRVGDYPGTLGTVLGSEAFFTPDAGGRTGSAGDYGMDFGNDPAGMRNVIVTDQAFLDAVNASTAEDRLSISFWQKNTAVGQASSFDFTSDVTTRAMHGHIPWSNGAVFFDHQTGFEDRHRVNTAVVNDWLTWTHIAIVKGRRVKQVWIDGVMVIDAPNHNPGMGMMNRLTIGSGQKAPNDFSVQAVIDDFAVFNDALTPAQIAELASGASPFTLVGGEPTFRITDISRTGDILSLTWDSDPGVNYAIRFSFDLEDWGADLDDSVPAAAGATSTTATFDLSNFGLEGETDLFFRVEK